MRSYGMYDASRGLTLALAAALGGLALWGATQVGTQTPGRFWTAMAIVAGGGFLLALANHVGAWTKGLRLRLSPSTFALAFLPVLVCVGWILLASQPASGWEEGRIHSWSNTIGILGVVHDIGLWNGVLAFAFGLTLGLSLDGVPAVAAAEAAPADAGPMAAAARPAEDDPLVAERRWTARRRPTAPPAPPAGEPGQRPPRTPTR